MGLIDGKVALVTGASRGLGRGIAHELGTQGARLVVTARTMTADQASQLAPDQPALPGTLADTMGLVQATRAEVLALPDLADVGAQARGDYECGRHCEDGSRRGGVKICTETAR